MMRKVTVGSVVVSLALGTVCLVVQAAHGGSYVMIGLILVLPIIVFQLLIGCLLWFLGARFDTMVCPALVVLFLEVIVWLVLSFYIAVFFVSDMRGHKIG